MTAPYPSASSSQTEVYTALPTGDLDGRSLQTCGLLPQGTLQRGADIAPLLVMAHIPFSSGEQSLNLSYDHAACSHSVAGDHAFDLGAMLAAKNLPFFFEPVTDD
jgi:hypothetical protein